MNALVVGGGVTGLSLAWQLCKAGLRVTVLDAGEKTGGLSTAQGFPEFTWDRFYHCILPSDSELIGLLTELGLSDQLVWKKTHTGFLLDGRIHPLDGALDLLRLPGIPFFSKLRIGMHAAVSPRLRDTPALDQMTAEAWLRRWCGRRGFERFWRPLLRAKLGTGAPRVTARFLFETIRRLASARKTSGSDECLGYVRGGYRAILAALRSQLEQRGVDLVVGYKATEVRHDRDGVSVLSRGNSVTGDVAFLTVPNPTLAALVPDLAPDVSRRLRETTYLGIVCTVAIGRSPLSEHYVLNLADDGLSLTGVIEMTNLIAREETAGRSLVYLPRYALADSELFQRSDDEIRNEALQDLHRIYPRLEPSWLLHAAVHRARLIQPVPVLGNSDLAPPLELVPGRVFAVNSASLPACPLNNNACVGLTRRITEQLLPRFRDIGHESPQAATTRAGNR